MASPVDPDEVRLIGENSYIRLRPKEGDPFSTISSHWRILYSPSGSGHVFFLESELTGNEVRVYSDNIALARWIQEEIEGVIRPGFADLGRPVAEATFSKHGDTRSSYTERIVSRDTEITLTWHDLGDPFLIYVKPGDIPGRPHGVYTVLLPATQAHLTLNGKTALGHPSVGEAFGYRNSTCCIAWSETWLTPRQ